MNDYPTEPCPAPNCRRPIIRALSDTQLQHVAIDPEPNSAGNVTLYLGAGGIIRATVNRNPGKMFGKRIYALHRTTCPAGNKSRLSRSR